MTEQQFIALRNRASEIITQVESIYGIVSELDLSERMQIEALGSHIRCYANDLVSLAQRNLLGIEGPVCANCGSITRPSGRCFVCSNCGQSSGCS